MTDRKGSPGGSHALRLSRIPIARGKQTPAILLILEAIPETLTSDRSRFPRPIAGFAMIQRTSARCRTNVG
ncbi:hypothetical protein C0Z20_20435 [Trinickia symbiotica]|uniref:Uncharacterized protein n=1 Tax=Trinickia symbiotica TaxID=863227 RepID=A0A2N7X0F1_9BURK|nr:hypothetical protein C0Z20_20435 [Trinickia symbiotica]